ncbi:MAG: hypothetical protein HQK50_03295 [Oligoflexia bacterium]|nr:hypothetical protein [Oligoflexia bacterium]MBF0364568.1 hypothetical protein [Oligoflexia bacterium]
MKRRWRFGSRRTLSLLSSAVMALSLGSAVGEVYAQTAQAAPAGGRAFTDRDIENSRQVSEALDTELRNQRLLQRKYQYSQSQLDRPLVNRSSSGFFKARESGLSTVDWDRNQGSRKCFEWPWTGGDYNRLAIDVLAEFCLISNLDPTRPIEELNSQVKATADAVLHANNSVQPILNSYFKATAPMQGVASAEGSIQVMGYTLWNYNDALPEVEYRNSIPILNVEREFPYTFALGPFPITFKVGARGSGVVNIYARATYLNASAKLLPQINVDSYLWGGLDVWLLSVGLVGNLKVIKSDLDLTGKLGLSVDPTSWPLKVVYRGEALGVNSMEALNGAFGLQIESEIDIPYFGRNFEYPLYTFEGFRQSATLFNEVVYDSIILH